MAVDLRHEPGRGAFVQVAEGEPYPADQHLGRLYKLHLGHEHRERLGDVGHLDEGWSLALCSQLCGQLEVSFAQLRVIVRKEDEVSVVWNGPAQIVGINGLLHEDSKKLQVAPDLLVQVDPDSPTVRVPVVVNR